MQNQNPQLQAVPDFDNYITQLGRALGYNDAQIPELRASFQNFNRRDRYKLIQNTQLAVDRLLQADRDLQDLSRGILEPYMQEIGPNWNAMNEQLAQLQILSLIQKKEDCQEVIKELLRILNEKIKTVNDVLRANLGQSNPQSGNLGQPNPQSGNLGQPNPQSGNLDRMSNFARTFNAARAFDPSLTASRVSDPRQLGGSNDDVYMNKYLISCKI
jgi:hypothetical protein